MSDKKKIILSIVIAMIGVIAFLAVVTGLTYAYFTANITGNQNASSIQVNTARLATVQFTDSALINASNMLPGTSVTKTFSVAMNGQNTIDMSYKVYMYWKNSGITDMVYTLSGGGTPLRVMPINTVQNTYKKEEIATGTFSANTAATHNYTLTITFPETGSNQNSQQGRAFSAYLQVEFAVGGTTICYNNENSNGYDCTPIPPWTDSCTAGSNALNCSILADNPEYTTQTVANDTMFQKIAVSQEYYNNLPSVTVYNQYDAIETLGKDLAIVQNGLWTENRAGKTEDNLPVYFYRGAVQNNYVSFAGKKWRMVRINEDGSVKLILGGNSTTDGYAGTTTAFNLNNGTVYLDYSRSDNALKVANEDWYSDNTKGNLDEYETYIADTKFCNDKSVAATPGNDIFYGAFARISGFSLDGNFTLNARTKTPQYKCPNASDNYVYKIGALTADEVAYAGGLSGISNASYYLYDNAQSSGVAGDWWLFSPSDYSNGNAYVFRVLGSAAPGAPDYRYVPYTLGFRPAISLKSDTLILEGDGTQGDPYVITE